MRMRINIQRAVLGGALSLMLGVAAAKACDQAIRTPEQRHSDALKSFEASDFVYRGVALRSFNAHQGGRFLVLKSYKGPAAALDLVPLPSATDCYEGISLVPYGYWAGQLENPIFDGLEDAEVVDAWKGEGFVERIPWNPELILIAPIVLLLLAVGRLLIRRRRRAVRI